MSFEQEQMRRSKGRQSGNMQDVLDKHDKSSVDWDNFDAPDDNPAEASQSVSEVYNQSK